MNKLDSGQHTPHETVDPAAMLLCSAQSTYHVIYIRLQVRECAHKRPQIAPMQCGTAPGFCSELQENDRSYPGHAAAECGAVRQVMHWSKIQMLLQFHTRLVSECWRLQL